MSDDAAEQLEMTRQTWAVLQQEGVVPGSELKISAYFFAPERAEVDRLADGLRGLGWTVEPAVSRRGLVRRRAPWALHAYRVLGGIGLQVLDEMVTSLEGESARCGAEFDGWGAAVPGSETL